VPSTAGSDRAGPRRSCRPRYARDGWTTSGCRPFRGADAARPL
jgi:hypothetical protein